MRAGGFKALIDTDKWSLVGERSRRWSFQSRCFQLPRAANAVVACRFRAADIHFEEKNEGRLLSCVHT